MYIFKKMQHIQFSLHSPTPSIIRITNLLDASKEVFEPKMFTLKEHSDRTYQTSLYLIEYE